MPKVTMSFILPDESYEHECALRGGEWKLIVYELANFLRSKLKHGHEYKTADEALQATKDCLWQECKNSNLDPWSD